MEHGLHKAVQGGPHTHVQAHTHARARSHTHMYKHTHVVCTNMRLEAACRGVSSQLAPHVHTHTSTQPHTFRHTCVQACACTAPLHGCLRTWQDDLVWLRGIVQLLPPIICRLHAVSNAHEGWQLVQLQHLPPAPACVCMCAA